MLDVRASYSTLSAADLLADVVPLYGVENPTSCEFWQRGINDTYKIQSTTSSYILRVYRNGWRTLSQIQFEVDALNYLHGRAEKVSFPIKRLDGEFITALNTPEGVRYAIVTSFAEGKPLSYHDVQDAYTYGVSVAGIHCLSDGFSSESARFELDHKHLLTEPLEYIKPFLSHRPECWAFLSKFAASLLESVNALNIQDLDFGFCHGDFHGWNAHASAGEITFYDFDCCGYGHRAYDIAVFRWGARLERKESERWQAFLRGYKSKRKISDVDLKLTTAYMAIRDIWLMGLHMSNAGDFGRGWIDDNYIDKRVKFLRAIEQEHFL